MGTVTFALTCVFDGHGVAVREEEDAKRDVVGRERRRAGRMRNMVESRGVGKRLGV